MVATPSRRRLRLRTISAGLVLAGALSFGVVGCDVGIEPSGVDQAPAPTTETSAQSSAPTYRLANGGKTLVDATGVRIRVAPKLVTGYVDAVTPNGDALDLSGWAAPADLGRAAEVVVAVVGTKSVAAVAPSGDRPDLVEGYDRPGLAKAGYAIGVPKSSLDCSAPDQGLEVFGVAGDTASPLEWLGDTRKRVAGAC